MVLQNIRVSNGAQRNPNSENTPPTMAAGTSRQKGLVSRIYQDAASRRRARVNGSSTTLAPKYRADKALKRKKDTKTKKSTSVKFTVTTVPTIADVEMAAASGLTDGLRPKSYPISLPRELSRPAYKEILLEAVYAADSGFEDMDILSIQQSLEAFAPQLLKSLNDVKVAPVKDRLPKELTVLASDMSDILPSHMLAIFGRAPSAPASTTSSSSSASSSSSSAPRPTPRKVTLYPIHSIVLAANCANLPTPPPTLPTPIVPEQHVSLPVWSMCLPSPMTYPQLSTYLYTKNTDFILRAFLPTPPPQGVDLLGSGSDDEGDAKTQTKDYAAQLASTFTVQALTKCALTVHGLWQNVCALGVFDDALWEAMDGMWAVLLMALGIATGTEMDES